MKLGFWRGWGKPFSLGAGSTGGGSVSSYSISGFAYDADGSTPVEGATVALGAYSTISAADGSFTISSISPGTSGSLTATKAGYSWAAISISAMSGNLIGQNFANAWWAAAGSAASVVVAYEPIGAADLATSYINIANPGTKNAAPGVAPSGTASGWKFNGTTEYLTTQDSPTAQTHTYFMRYSGLAANGYLFGMSNAGFGVFFRRTGPAEHRSQNGNNAIITATAPPASAVVCVAGIRLYIDAVEIHDDFTVVATSGVDIYLGCLNSSGVPGTFAGITVSAYARYNSTLTPSQISAITTAMQALAP